MFKENVYNDERSNGMKILDEYIKSHTDRIPKDIRYCECMVGKYVWKNEMEMYCQRCLQFVPWYFNEASKKYYGCEVQLEKHLQAILFLRNHAIKETLYDNVREKVFKYIRDNQMSIFVVDDIRQVMSKVNKAFIRYYVVSPIIYHEYMLKYQRDGYKYPQMNKERYYNMMAELIRADVK